MMYRNASLPEFKPNHGAVTNGAVMDPSMAAKKRRLAVQQLMENMRHKQPRIDEGNVLNDGSSVSDESESGSSDGETSKMASHALARANFGVPKMNGPIELACKKGSASNASIASEPSALTHRATMHSLKKSRLTTSMPRISNEGLVLIHQSPRSTAMTSSSPKPDSVLKSVIEQAGFEYKTFDALNLKGFFVEVTEDVVKAYEMDVITALRDNDIHALRHFHSAGRQLQCANKFGDSIVHTACRRGSLDIIQFLLKEAGLSCKVCCDYGRTSLHDACWTSSPNFSVIDELLDACPDLLYTKDKRGFTPLDYARPAQYGDWCKYLSERGADRLLPKELELQRLTESQD